MAFESALKFVLNMEGGFVDDPDDKGGATNKGITQRTYNSYRKSHNKSAQSVKNISDAEVSDIYYNNYYKASGADKIQDPKLALAVFDTAVNMGVSRAIKFLEQSGRDFNKYLFLRKEKYKEFAGYGNQQKFLKGWLNRVDRLNTFTTNLT